jgi:hypothetical protein
MSNGKLVGQILQLTQDITDNRYKVQAMLQGWPPRPILPGSFTTISPLKWWRYEKGRETGMALKSIFLVLQGCLLAV